LLVEYQDEPLTIGFNVAYLLDVLGAIDSDAIVIHLKDSKHSAIIKRADSDDALYVVMPMHL
jgi:DNA polymerase-3 subunit beta